MRSRSTRMVGAVSVRTDSDLAFSLDDAGAAVGGGAISDPDGAGSTGASERAAPSGSAIPSNSAAAASGAGSSRSIESSQSPETNSKTSWIASTLSSVANSIRHLR